MLVRPIEANKLQNKTSQEENEKGYPLISEDSLFSFLESRIGKLDGVVITGGEPTIQPDLIEFISRIKNRGFLVKLDTNGTAPTVLKKLLKLGLVDYIAMDIKAAPLKYHFVTNSQLEMTKIKKSIKIIKESRLPYEFRTTLVPGIITRDDIEKIGKLIAGAEKWYLQIFKNDTNLVNPKLQKLAPYTNKEMAEMRKIGEKFVKQCFIR